MKLDPAVAEALNIDLERASVTSAGGGGCSSASTARISAMSSDGAAQEFFMKSESGDDAETMFHGMTKMLKYL
jgi:protein-ribulosamine 3-kinase